MKGPTITPTRGDASPVGLLLGGALLHAALPSSAVRSFPSPKMMPYSKQMEDDFLREFNSAEHHEELLRIARSIGDFDGVDWSKEALAAVRIVGVDDYGITVEEVLCSSHDQRCIAVPLHVDWPTFPCPQCAADMRTAFAQLSMRAFDAHQTELPPVYADQQRQLDAEMALMNRQFGKLLKFYALRHLRDAFAPTEQLEKATLSQLNFEGLSLECETILLGDEELGGVLKRFRWSGSVLYDTPCRSAEEVEDRLIAMFTDETETTRDAARTRDAERTRDAAPPPAARADNYEAAAKAAWLARLNPPAWGRGQWFGGASSSPRHAASATRYTSWPPESPEATQM